MERGREREREANNEKTTVMLGNWSLFKDSPLSPPKVLHFIWTGLLRCLTM